MNAAKRAVQTWTWNYHICYVISWSSYFNQSEVLASRLQRRSEREWMIAAFKKDVNQNINLHLAAPGDNIGHRTELMMFRNDVSSINLSYKKFETYRLPPPFATNCFDYRSIGVKSAVTCINDCVLKKYNTFTRNISWHLRAIPDTPQYQDMKLKNGENSRNSDCYTKCQKLPCYEESFETSYKVRTEDAGTDYFTIILNVPKMFTEIRYNPKTTLISLVVNVGSSLSWWTGLSVLGTLTLATNVKKFFVVIKQKVVFHNQPLATQNSSRVFKVVPLRKIAK